MKYLFAEKKGEKRGKKGNRQIMKESACIGVAVENPGTGK